MVQLVVVVGGLTGALLLTNSIDIPASVWRFVPIIVVSILGGLAIYNTFFALLGSLISRQEDASQVMLPVFIPLMAGFFVGQGAQYRQRRITVGQGPHLFPLTAPMMLAGAGGPGRHRPWEIALSLGLLALAVWLLIRIAGGSTSSRCCTRAHGSSWGQLIRLSRGAALD